MLNASMCTPFCDTALAYLCTGCGASIYHCSHNPALKCTSCASNSLPTFSSLDTKSAASTSSYLMNSTFNMDNEFVSELNAKKDEDEIDSWLLINPNNDMKNIGFPYVNHTGIDDMYHYNEPQPQSVHQVAYNTESRDSVVPAVDDQSLHSFSKCGSIHTLSDSLTFGNQGSLSFMDGFGINVPDIKISNISNSDNLPPEEASSVFPSMAPTPLTDQTNREAKVLRYKEKRKARKFEKKIRYTSRKAYAHNRYRVRGKFAKRPQLVPEQDWMLSFEEFGYGIVPS
ncbi:hypothetical protein RJ639_031534 [Escallonia herrerae]|uniref:CCT domain-containing protein n=1 Tax=Escallonia herrerae TaxID=1293975 RepID=A0AA88XEM8_9ASTE|nr:hypothetical protein RJ639_031534 [Escallonia herrerae]